MHLITLVSDQTLPNILFINQFGLDAFDTFFFITSQKMEEQGRTQAIIDCCGIPKNRFDTIIVNENSIIEIIRELQRKFARKEPICLNITGGNKLMSLAAFSHFSSPTTQVYYLPLGQPAFHRIWPTFEEVPITVEISLRDYLKAYGLRMLSGTTLDEVRHRIPEAKCIFQEMVRHQGKFPDILIHMAQSGTEHDDKPFYTGDWLEIWTGDLIRQHFGLRKEQVMINIKLSRSQNHNTQENTEYDVVFTIRNRLFVCECKVFTNGIFTKHKINSDWYKLAGLQLDFGLTATAFFITANTIQTRVYRNLNDLRKLYRIHSIADFHILRDADKRSSFLNKLLK